MDIFSIAFKLKNLSGSHPQMYQWSLFILLYCLFIDLLMLSQLINEQFVNVM